MPHIRGAVLFVIAGDDEMEYCAKPAQYDCISRATSAHFTSIAELPLAKHAHPMDARGLVGGKAAWLQMLQEMGSFLRAAFPDSAQVEETSRPRLARQAVADKVAV